MHTLYCLSIKGTEEHVHAIFGSYKSAIIAIYDIIVRRLKECIEYEGVDNCKRYSDQLKHLNEIRDRDMSEDKVTLFSIYTIYKTKNMITSENAFKNIAEHINARFDEIESMSLYSRKVCIPHPILTERTKLAWQHMDKHNYESVIEEMENLIYKRIEQLKQRDIPVIQGILRKSDDNFLCVQFCDSQEFMLNKSVYGIVVSPETGSNLSLQSTIVDPYV